MSKECGVILSPPSYVNELGIKTESFCLSDLKNPQILTSNLSAGAITVSQL